MFTSAQGTSIQDPGMDGFQAGPEYAGGRRGKLAGMYQQLGQQSPYRVMNDPYMQDWANQGQQNQLSDRQKLQDLYAQLQKQAAGGMTPQQQAQLSGMQQAAANQGSLANSVAGGARARVGAQAALTQNMGVVGAQNVQKASALKASDQISATKQMQQVASMQRANDLQAQGLTAEDAQRQAQMEVQARGLNIQQQLGYGGLEAQAMQHDYQMYADAIRRFYQNKKIGQQETDSNIQAGVDTAQSAASAGFM